MVWSQDEINAFKARSVQTEGNSGKVDDYVNVEQSPRRISSSASPRKWKPTPTDENRRSDEWLGHGSPCGKKRSWKVKEIQAVVPDLDQD
eukprot:Nitzschia sp. Nitz4//scaffold53_size117307//52616//52885//NITZ4_003768-RA/size117307-processed-gene-0.156-mRNA-1//-1//CDS//3329554199//1581//frame0